MDDDIGPIVHAGTIISNRALDIDGQVSRDANCHGVMAARVENVEMDIVISLLDLVQGGV
jgi:hypothetical protein